MTDTRPIVEEFGLDLAHVPASTVRAVRIGLALASGVALLLGIALLVWPGKTLVVGAVLVAINFLVSGAFRIVIGIVGSAFSGGLRALSIIMGVLLLIGGVVMLRNLTASAAVLLLVMTIAVGIGWIIEGIMALVDSDRAGSRAWAIALGIISIVAGIGVMVVPVWSAQVLVILTAITLVIMGAVGLGRAFFFGRHHGAEL